MTISYERECENMKMISNIQFSYFRNKLSLKEICKNKGISLSKYYKACKEMNTKNILKLQLKRSTYCDILCEKD